ncbi:hypothetical protein GUJ93_ZPchr0006g43458 [Zizania palustris]|uniref:Uncharacterized protein n=1 Tax=Zizania palustris TaxID=103762 RepID=A0A8J5T2D2_ZIZPA|nr:hypothetical protein GUJ93_ZPchr0006g43458 [Zizania palustris]
MCFICWLFSKWIPGNAHICSHAALYAYLEWILALSRNPSSLNKIMWHPMPYYYFDTVNLGKKLIFSSNFFLIYFNSPQSCLFYRATIQELQCDFMLGTV